MLDKNDNEPQFVNTPYNFNVKETEDVGRTVFKNVLVTDADEGRNAEVELSCLKELSSPDACETFDIFAEASGPGRYNGVLMLKKPLNYEDKSSYDIIIEARDGGEEGVKKSTTSIIVQVEDVQDQDPVFLNGPYSETVPEGTQPGSSIFDVQAIMQLWSNFKMTSHLL